MVSTHECGSCAPWRQLPLRRGCQSASGCRWSRRGTSAETRLPGIRPMTSELLACCRPFRWNQVRTAVVHRLRRTLKSRRGVGRIECNDKLYVIGEFVVRDTVRADETANRRRVCYEKYRSKNGRLLNAGVAQRSVGWLLTELDELVHQYLEPPGHSITDTELCLEAVDCGGSQP